MPKRPLGLIVIAFLLIFSFVLGVFTLIIAPLMLIDFGKEVLNEFYQIYLIFYSIMTFASLIIAYGLLKGRRWAWIATFILSGMNIINSIIQNFGFGIIISLIIIFYLTLPQVKAYYKKI